MTTLVNKIIMILIIINHGHAQSREIYSQSRENKRIEGNTLILPNIPLKLKWLGSRLEFEKTSEKRPGLDRCCGSLCSRENQLMLTWLLMWQLHVVVAAAQTTWHEAIVMAGGCHGYYAG